MPMHDHLNPLRQIDGRQRALGRYPNPKTTRPPPTNITQRSPRPTNVPTQIQHTHRTSPREPQGCVKVS